MEYLVGLICLFGFVTLLGHGIWLLLQAIFRSTVRINREGRVNCLVCGAPNPRDFQRCSSCMALRSSPEYAEMGDLAAAKRQADRFRAQGHVDQPAFEQFLAR